MIVVVVLVVVAVAAAAVAVVDDDLQIVAAQADRGIWDRKRGGV